MNIFSGNNLHDNILYSQHYSQTGHQLLTSTMDNNVNVKLNKSRSGEDK